MSETAATQPDPNLLELAIPVSERVQIHDVILEESRAKRAKDGRFAQAVFSLRHQFSPVGVEREDSSISVRLAFALHSTRNGEVEADPALLIEAVFLLRYSISSLEGIGDQNLDAFAATNGVYNAWPYWREYVQNITVRMGLPPIVAPVFRFAVASAPAPLDQSEIN